MKPSLWALLFSTMLFSCKEETPVPSKTDLLTGKNWKWVAGSISPAYDIFGIGVLVGNDYFTRVPECWRDDRWVFSKAQKFTHEEGATRCNLGDPQIYVQGTWTFEPGENAIKVSKNGSGGFLWTVNELTSTSLVVTETFKDDGQTYNISYSFGH